MHGNELREKIIGIIKSNRPYDDFFKHYDFDDGIASEEIIKLFEKEFNITINKGIK